MTDNPASVRVLKRPATVLGQVLQGIAQLFLLFTAAVFLFCMAMMYVGQQADKKDPEAEYRRRASRAVSPLNRDYNYAKRQRASAESAAQQNVQNVDVTLSVLKRRSPRPASSGSSSTTPPARPAEPETPAVDPLIVRFRDVKAATSPSELIRLNRLPTYDRRLPELAKLLATHASSPAAPLSQYVNLAIKWDDSELGKACVAAYRQQFSPRPPPGAAESLSRLFRLLEDPSIAELILQAVPENSVRQNGELNELQVARYGGMLAAGPAHGELLAKYVLEDSQEGDVVRAALGFFGTWPPEVVAAVKTLPIELDAAFEGRLQTWLDGVRPSDQVCDELFGVAARRIPRTATGDAQQDTRGVGLLSVLTTSTTAPRVAQAAVRLESANPVASRMLARLMLSSFPLETFDVLAAANDGKGVELFGDGKDEESDRRRESVDRRIAWRLLQDEDGSVAAATSQCLAAWGGPATVRVLRARKVELGLRNPYAKVLSDTVKRIEERVGNQPGTGK